MLKTEKLCKTLSTTVEKYYIGDRDDEGRKDGTGENHWSGAKSLEWYEGRLLRDTMHGIGNYYWRFLGPENAFVTYEGYFYCNQIHGYGLMSYPNGRTFYGLFMNNIRWGPGVESHCNLCYDVGLWHGDQLVRLAWSPPAPSIIPDFMSTSTGRAIVESHRELLNSRKEIIGETNNAIEMLKRYGADPRDAVARRNKLFSKHCTDIGSPICDLNYWNQTYYKESIDILEEANEIQESKNNENEESITYYAWNNNRIMIDMMKCAYKHEKQRDPSLLDLKSILSGPRSHYKQAGPRELECRNMLMACFLGHIVDVARLVNERNIHPNVLDAQGNSAIMYAVCGNQSEIIQFLAEAGSDVDTHNDNCYTPLALALMRYTCVQNDVPISAMHQALLPPLTTSAPFKEEHKIEWNIIRDRPSSSPGVTLTKSPSKATRNMSSKKIKSLLSLKESKGKTNSFFPKILERDNEILSDELKLYNEICREYLTQSINIFMDFNNTKIIPYLFQVCDIVKEIEVNEGDQKKPEKIPKKVISKVMKETIKTSKDVLWDTKEKEIQLVEAAQKHKQHSLSLIMSTILKLLSTGANPKFVKCPQPALFIAISSNSPTLVQYLIKYGADVNETYEKLFNYSPLDLVICRPFTRESFEIAKVILENGADASHRLNHKHETKNAISPDVIIPGPTLLHVILGKKAENEYEEDIRRQLIKLLLDYNCNASTLFKGRSALDVAMSKNFNTFDTFIKNPKTDLNIAINEANQSVLVKVFNINFFRSISSAERRQMITNVLLYGANPLLRCQNGNDIYENIFVFAKQTLMEMENSLTKTVNPAKIQQQDETGKKPDKHQIEDKLLNKSMGKVSVDEVEEYKQAMELVTDCARLIYIRWLQAKMMTELIKVINRFRHRHWNMIVKELPNNKNCLLWLNPQRCLEIWDILCSTKNKIYNDTKILRHLLCILIFMSWRNYDTKNDSSQILTASLKDAVDSDVTNILRQHYRREVASEYEVDQKFFNGKPELDKKVSF